MWPNGGGDRCWGQMLTYCGDHRTIYTNIGSLCYTSETNMVLYVNHTSIRKKISWPSLNKHRLARKGGERKGKTTLYLQNIAMGNLHASNWNFTAKSITISY